MQALQVVTALGHVGKPPGHELEGEAAERVEVGARAGAPADQELGGEVRRGADDALVPLGAHDGGAEVDDDDPAGAVLDDDVGELEVAMDEAGPVHRGEPVADVSQDLDAAMEGHVLPLHQVLVQEHREASPRHELHDDVRALAVLAEGVHRDHVLVAELRQRDGLLPEPLPALLGVVAAQDLDRDVALERDVEGPVDRAHPAVAELSDDAVTAVDDLVRCELHRPQGTVIRKVTLRQVGVASSARACASRA